MRKKLGLGILATLFVASAVVFASTNITSNNSNTCPDRPGCICSPNKAAGFNASRETKTESCTTPCTESCTTICPDRPGCICTK